MRGESQLHRHGRRSCNTLALATSRRITSAWTTATRVEHRRHGRLLITRGHARGPCALGHAQKWPTLNGMADGIPYSGFFTPV